MGDYDRFNPQLHFPSLRRMLIKLHTDLFTIHERIDQWAAYYPTELTNLEKLTLVLEDRRFFHHHGVELRSVARELLRALTLRRHGGASTIDMQFVRTCTGYKQRTLARKLYEVLLSALIQLRYSKLSILRSYLRIAFFGSRLYGADAAARRMFGKNSSSLNPEEAAVVAAMLVYPRPVLPTETWSPGRPPKFPHPWPPQTPPPELIGEG